jgi:hypothetical protein
MIGNIDAPAFRLAYTECINAAALEVAYHAAALKPSGWRGLKTLQHKGSDIDLLSLNL